MLGSLLGVQDIGEQDRQGPCSHRAYSTVCGRGEYTLDSGTTNKLKQL